MIHITMDIQHFSGTSYTSSCRGDFWLRLYLPFFVAFTLLFRFA